MGYFRFQLNVAVILSLNPLFTLALLFMCILDLCTLLNTEDFTCNTLFFFILTQVMETKNMLYLVTEFAKNGEIFGKWYHLQWCDANFCTWYEIYCIMNNSYYNS